MMTYRQLRDKQEKEFNAFPCFFAFSNQQFNEGMEKLGVQDTAELYRGAGGMFYRKTDSDKLKAMMERFEKELFGAYENDDFLYDAFLYELGNHEYSITLDPEETCDALGYTVDEVMQDARKLGIFRQAEQEYLKGCGM